MIPARLDPAWYENQMHMRGIPEHMFPGYLRYLLDGVLPGDFLTALLRNDLRAFFLAADAQNLRTLAAHVAFLVHDAPAACWGSPERVAAWIKSFPVTVPHE